jgi:hypothetical protein
MTDIPSLIHKLRNAPGSTGRHVREGRSCARRGGIGTSPALLAPAPTVMDRMPTTLLLGLLRFRRLLLQQAGARNRDRTIRSYSDLSDSATTFDPEEQFDRDIDERMKGMTKEEAVARAFRYGRCAPMQGR